MSRPKLRLKKLTVISMLLMSSVFLPFLMNIVMPSPRLGGNKVNNEDIGDNLPVLSVFGTHSWWDKSFHSRHVINITNSNAEKLYNYGVSISFNFTQLVLDGLMKSNLEDIRIIEYKGVDPEDSIPYERKYYFQKDYPTADNVTVWFETNVTVNNGDSELDTYLYYGNDDANIDTALFMNETTSDTVANNFGWIRNGNFEQDPGVPGVDGAHTIESDSVFGWYYIDDIPDDIKGEYVPDGPDPYFYQYNLSTYAGDQEQRNEGTYTFKFGDIAHTVFGGAGLGKDVTGTLFSAPFVVPTVSGGSNKIYVNAWRNFRTYDNKNNKLGVFVRIAKDYDSTSVDLHTPWGDAEYSEGYVEYWNSVDGTFYELYSVYDSVPNVYTSGGDLTGDLNIDVSDYQGEVIFLEFGMVVYAALEQENKFEAFAQVDNVRFTYDLDVSLDSDAERRKAEVEIIVRDVDGRIVPNAEVSLIMNSSQPIGNQVLYGPLNTSVNNGSVLFTSVTYENYYNISVNYTIASTGFETVVYNSSVIGGRNFNVTESQHTFTIYVDIWTIDFEIVDYDKEPLNYGYIAIYNDTKNGENLENLTLNAADGKSTFRWRNQSSYYYKVFYENFDYNLHTTALNESYIYRSNYDQVGEKFQSDSILVNVSNIAPIVSGNFKINKTIYTNGSLTEIGNKKILTAEINLTIPNYGASQKFTSISIYYIDKNNYYEENENYRIYFNDDPLDLDDFFSFNIDMRSPDPDTIPSTLEGNKYEVYGLRIVAEGSNFTQCDGTIDFSFNETTNIYNVTEMSKLNIRVVDSVGDDFQGVVTVIVNSTIKGQKFYVNLTTFQAPLLNGYAYGEINQVPLWYLRGYEYNISINFNNADRQFNVTYAYPDQWRGPDYRDYYNYTLTQQSNISLFIREVNAADSQLRLNDLEFVDEVTWGENISVQVNFTKTDDDWGTFTQVTTDATVTLNIESLGQGSSIVLVEEMTHIGNGIFNVTFNSSRLSAGGLGKYYYIIISGEREGWGIGVAPNVSNSIFIKTIQTNLSMHDYYNFPNIIETDSQTYGESVNLTFSYSNTSRLKGATLTYEWLSFDPIQFYGDPINDGYYTTSIDTSLAGTWGTKSIKIVAALENYTTQTFF
ncbi:MAG TPA: hypothetical protein ENI29_01720, partial [bacterium]|nr:hypothetical protein [bacterium]